jgi:hypothetical protein
MHSYITRATNVPQMHTEMCRISILQHIPKTHKETFSEIIQKLWMELQFHPGPARKLSTNLYDIYHF